ncbi:hypothetical protein GCM10008906_22190 [Clostridium oceanicum]|uniref:Uncharacterized protein n=1 Tax=Clostridium oceanicum TaxID=1543 RepID=A0ABN1JJS0_9CLOT
MIIGHGNDDRIEKIKEIIKSYEEKYDFTKSSRNRINEYECLLRYLKWLRKDVDICKSECKWSYYQVKTKLVGY